MVYYRETIQIKISQRRRHLGQSPGASKCRASVVFSLGVRARCLTAVCDTTHTGLPTRETHPSLCVWFVLGLHYIDMVDWSVVHVVDSVSKPPKLLPHVTLEVFVAWPALILNHTVRLSPCQPPTRLHPPRRKTLRIPSQKLRTYFQTYFTLLCSRHFCFLYS